MCLIYLYIAHLSRCIESQGFPFSTDFAIQYDEISHRLHITKKSSQSAPIFPIFGVNIKSLNLIVGRNGCGKSTILNLLGMKREDRQDEFPPYSDRNWPSAETGHTWFALYHLAGDTFAAEGYGPELLDRSQTSGMWLQHHYSVGFQYDFNKQDIVPGSIQALQELDMPGEFFEQSGGNSIEDDIKKKHIEKKYIESKCIKSNPLNHLLYLSYHIQTPAPWYSSNSRRMEDGGLGFMFRRTYIGEPDYAGVCRYLYDAVHNREMEEKIASVPSAVKIRIQLSDRLREKEQAYDSAAPETIDYAAQADRKVKFSVGRLIYGEDQKLLSMPIPQISAYMKKNYQQEEEYTFRQCMVIKYLENVLGTLLIRKQVPSKIKYQEPDEAGNGAEARYEYRKGYLLAFLKELLKVEYEENYDSGMLLDSEDYRLAEDFCRAIEQIPEPYFERGELVSVPLKECQENFLIPFMKVYDRNQKESHTLNHEAFLRVSVENLSSGEIRFIGLYASLYSGILRNSAYSKGDTCILLLDEPDERFHPEWSRQFIKNLTELLQTEPFSDYQYQIIMATHSPLLLSDVPKENICCLECRDGYTVQSKAAYGFMSNINDILLDSFFVESPFGAFAETYVDGIMEELGRLEDRIENKKKENRKTIQETGQKASLKGKWSEEKLGHRRVARYRRQDQDDDRNKFYNKEAFVKEKQQLHRLEVKIQIIDEPIIREGLERKIHTLRRQLW
ncbi:AAA family ATPase [Clostridium sp. AM58-1XD]|uniref:AAA family ATPase n=1 Tax=Clostridium sp. AM58-1XD TaxID=2292307 RepID=UPI0015F7651D|nr:AAA family ATPase [Clostridium sp. AM58-1XD]